MGKSSGGVDSVIMRPCSKCIGLLWEKRWQINQFLPESLWVCEKFGMPETGCNVS